MAVACKSTLKSSRSYSVREAAWAEDDLVVVGSVSRRAVEDLLVEAEGEGSLREGFHFRFR